jgi:hypothetical protein
LPGSSHLSLLFIEQLKLIYEKILKPEVLDKNIRPLAAHEAGNDDWRYLSAALLFK